MEVNMKSWLESTDGVNYLVRAGEGRITAVEPIGIPDLDGAFALHRVEIDCVSPRGFARSIRFTARAQVSAGSFLHGAAVAALENGESVNWEIQWHRHSWVPGHVSIVDLDLDTDATAQLVALERIPSQVAEPVEFPSRESL